MASTIQDKLIPVDLGSEMKKSFISYAMAVIVSRALPDVRDGLKPVHRRILYAMNELGMTPDKPFRKCARVVGDVLGKYHPHGDSSVYDALVRLAQDFNMRYTLVEGQGNFGSVDGDGAAAMRYTECRLDKLTAYLIGEIDKDTVDFYPNFDETLMQPTVLPSRYPNLLVNGANGIAVGMATNIPTHNLGEVIDGCVHMIDHPDCSIDELMRYIKGPDFPTGAQIMGTSGIRAAYHTGRGRIIMRAKNTIEQMSDNRSRIVITEIPYGVNKANLITKIAELHKEKRLEGIHGLRDESDRSGMRIVIELKKGVYPQVVLNYLYKHTSLQETFGANMLALVNGEPKVLNLREILYHYLEHQKDVVQRRTRYDLDKAEARAHIVEGLLKALEHIDEIVSIIRHSGDTNIARNALCERFGFSEKQAQAILDMRLARLTGLESDKLQAEYEQLVQDINYYRSLLADEHLLMGVIRQELIDIRDKYSDERRTEITPLEDEIDVEDLIQPDDMVVTMTNYGYVKRISHSNYRAQHRGGKGISGMTTREEDYAEQMIVVNTHDDIMFFTNRGRVYSLKCYQIPEAGRTARGIAIVNLLQIAGDEKVTAIIPMPANRTEGYLVMMTRKGMIKRTPVEEFANLRKTGLIAITLREDDELCSVNMTDGSMSLIVGSRMGRALRITEKSIRVIGRSGMGVRVMKLAEQDELIDMSRITENQQILSITTKGYGKRTPVEQYREQGRNGMGIKAITLSEKSGQLAAQLAVDIDEDIMLITDDGTVIRMHVADIRESGRTTQGVRLMRLRDGAQIVSVARIDAESEDEEIETVTPENTEDESEVVVDDSVIAETDDDEQESSLNEESEL